MSKTGIAFLLIYVIALLGTFVFPPLGVWGFVFESNYHPPLHSWGRALRQVGDRWSLCIGAAMIVSVLLNWSKYPKATPWRHLQTWLLLFYVVNCFLVTLWGYTFESSLNRAIDLAKWFAVYICIAKTHGDRRWCRVVLYIYILAMMHSGFDLTFNPKGGREVKEGPVTAYGDNFVAAHVVALLPLTALWVVTPGSDLRVRWV